MNRLLKAAVFLSVLSLSGPALAEMLNGTLYKAANCPCCEGHVNYLRKHDIILDVKPVDDLEKISKAAGIPSDYQGCHTILLDGYAIEGHVTFEIIEKLLKEQPADVVGISLPGMPVGVPGMDGDKTGPYEVFAIKKNGTASVFAAQ